MLFFSLIVSTFSALVAAQAASGANPLVPISGSIQAGQPLTINWQKNTPGTVSLQLRWGTTNALNPGTTIASGIPNGGTYTWTPPPALKAGTDYTIEIISADGQTNYSPPFGIQSSGTGLPSSASSTSASGSSSSAKASSTTSGSSSSSSASDSSTTSTSSTTSSSSSTSSKPTNSASSVPKSSGNKLGGGLFAAVGLVAAAL